MATDGDQHRDRPDDVEAADDTLDDLKQLLAAEGVSSDEDWSPDELLGELTPAQSTDREVRPKRRTERRQRGHRAQDEQTFRDLESQLASDPLDISITEDHMTATVGRIGEENDLESILAELSRQKVSTGLDEKALIGACQHASGGRPQYDVVAARGTPPVTHHPPSLRQCLPDALHRNDPLPLESLHNSLAGPSLDVVENWQGAVHVVHRGDVLTDIAPASFDPGVDVFGEPVVPEFGALPELPHGENTELSEGGLSVIASCYGYAGILDGEPAVVPPLFVSSDAMEAYFICIDARRMPAPTREEFDQLLELRWIEQGVLDDAVDKLLAALDSERELPRRVQIAAGTAPRNGSDGTIEQLFPVTDLVRWNELQTVWKAEDLTALTSAIEKLYGAGRAMHAVHNGDIIARRTPAQEGVPGNDVRGEELKAEDGVDVELTGGTNVELNVESLELRATCCGWLAVYGSDQLSVVAPLWLAKGLLSVCLLHLPTAAAPCLPTAAELAELSQGDGRLEGLDLSGWDKLRQRLEAAPSAEAVVVLASGEAAQPGVDGRFDWAIEVGGRAGRILEDGSIDLRDRGLITVVKSGDLIGRLHPARPGTPGRDALGAEIAAPPLVEFEVVCDAQVEARQVEEEGVIAYHA
ncbi:MAG: DUF342 domain-containing protein, partial [Gemmatimonadetes bacterium]|nr:DUF342 domain-containing protein [Gemmatimonadota bacterium]